MNEQKYVDESESQIVIELSDAKDDVLKSGFQQTPSKVPLPSEPDMIDSDREHETPKPKEIPPKEEKLIEETAEKQNAMEEEIKEQDCKTTGKKGKGGDEFGDILESMEDLDKEIAERQEGDQKQSMNRVDFDSLADKKNGNNDELSLEDKYPLVNRPACR